MAVIKANAEDTKMLARLMRAEAEGEGRLGMLLVGNVGVNRVRARCSDFTDVNSIERMVFQSPGGFEAVHYPYFYQRARERDIRLAERVIKGERFHPGEFALWFFRPDAPCPPEWWGQPHSGQFKEHCFYQPTVEECNEVYNTY
jgi:N-acetylmuramoyl-L-alanine amidase